MKFEDVKLISPNMHLVSGEPGGGKTVLLFSIADRLHRETGKDVYVSLREEDSGIEKYKVPKYIHSHRGFTYPLDSIVITDDLQRIAHARRAVSNVNVFLDQLHALLRHDNIDFLYDTQTLSGIGRNIILRSNYRWYKRPYQLEASFGRPEIEDEVNSAKSLTSKKEAMLYSKVYSGKVTDIPLPSYWSEELSTMHRRVPSKKEQAKTLWRRIW